MTSQLSPLVALAISWMYQNRSLLSAGYSEQDPVFKEAKALFTATLRKSGSRETEESLIHTFEEAMNRV